MKKDIFKDEDWDTIVSYCLNENSNPELIREISTAIVEGKSE